MSDKKKKNVKIIIISEDDMKQADKGEEIEKTIKVGEKTIHLLIDIPSRIYD